MTYAMAWALQEAVFAVLAAAPSVGGAVGGRIWDAPPHGEREAQPGEDFVTIGDELVRPFDTADGHGGLHDFTVTVHSGRDGFRAAKELAAAICDLLLGAPLPLARGRLVALRFVQGQALRGRPPERRRIVLRFRAVVEEG